MKIINNNNNNNNNSNSREMEEGNSDLKSVMAEGAINVKFVRIQKFLWIPELLYDQKLIRIR
jgi:hypothetical protein